MLHITAIVYSHVMRSSYVSFDWSATVRLVKILQPFMR